MSKKTLDMFQKQYGRLTVTAFERVAYGAKKDRTGYYCVCLCECGAQTVVPPRDLLNDHVKSCGCLHRESMSEIGKRQIKKGQTLFGELRNGRSSTYRAWLKIRSCCRAGIAKGVGLVCHEYDTRWDDYAEFLRDFGDIGFFETISRKDRSIPWSKENCYVNRGGNQSNRVLKDEIARGHKLLESETESV
jgi:hypothetical protein